jgi:hypothetical protein
MNYEMIILTLAGVSVIGIIFFICLLLALSVITNVLLFKRYDSLYKEYEEFMNETSMYGEIDSVLESAEELKEHCEIMRGAIEHSEEVLYLNFSHHIEKFLFQLAIIRKDAEDDVDG